MSQAKNRPGSHRNQKDSQVTDVYRYRDFLSPKYWLTWLAIAGLYLLAWLPIFIRIPLARLLSVLLYLAVSSRRHVVQTNIQLCFPELDIKAQRKLIRKTYFANTLNFFETAHAWCRPVDRLSFEIRGQEHLEKAFASGRGILVLSGHFGPIDILGALLKGKVRFSIMYRKHDNALFNYFMTKAREDYCDETIARKDIKGLIRALRKGKAIWYAPDQDYGRKSSVFVPFFGIETATITMTSKLAETTGAVVLPVSAYRTDNYRGFVLNIEEPINIPSGDEIADACHVNQWLEQRIREHPDQYLWLHKRFKTRPESEPSLY
ncbi:MAG: lipid A biosynthesis acyltransferase [Reinekea sp.]|jgi:Kdo2-lipid IVA lauroyltransferase/acyltransferase